MTEAETIQCLRAGDVDSALAFWGSTRWTESERRRMKRFLSASREMADRVLVATVEIAPSCAGGNR